MWSGGSIPSASDTWFATTVPVQFVLDGKSFVGSSVATVKPALLMTVKGSGVPVGHSSLKPPVLAAASIASLKVIATLVLRATSVAPLAGVVLLTLGAASWVVNEKL